MAEGPGSGAGVPGGEAGGSGVGGRLTVPLTGEGEVAEFLGSLADFPATLPDPVALHFLREAGFDSADPALVRLLALSAHKFLSDLVLDAIQQARIRGLGQAKKATKDVKYTLTMDLLQPILQEYGIPSHKPPYTQ